MSVLYSLISNILRFSGTRSRSSTSNLCHHGRPQKFFEGAGVENLWPSLLQHFPADTLYSFAPLWPLLTSLPSPLYTMQRRITRILIWARTQSTRASVETREQATSVSHFRAPCIKRMVHALLRLPWLHHCSGNISQRDSNPIQRAL